MVILIYYNNRGVKCTEECSSVEDAILRGRKARCNGGANFRQYSIDNGKTWLNL